MNESFWLKGVTNELELISTVLILYSDSQSVIHLSNSGFYERTKHIDVRLHFFRHVMANGWIKMEKMSTKDNLIDIMTNVVPVRKFKLTLDLLKVGV